jgi:sarcosine/dimethylglycine N-methyltransferase
MEKARDYYDSGDADNFYFHVWGGEDIHVGLYKSDDEPIFDASRRTVEKMAAKISKNLDSVKILDIGAGYGGSARYLAREYNVPVVCLNLSVVQNDRNRAMNREQGLDHLIKVVDGSFEDLPFEDNSFEVVWSQDAILHSGDRKKVFDEVNRVLKSGGDFIFTDPMQKVDADPEVLKPVLNRIHLSSMGSFDVYREFAKALNWQTAEIEDLSTYLTRHYSRVLQELEKRDAELAEFCSKDYRERMKVGLRHWIDAGNEGVLSWGILHFRK